MGGTPMPRFAGGLDDFGKVAVDRPGLDRRGVMRDAYRFAFRDSDRAHFI